jgi:hypothetical protein
MESLEQWKSIPNCSKYEASSLGRIRNINTKTIIKGSFNKNGYPNISIRLDVKPQGNKNNTLVKKLNMIMAETFLTPSQNPKDKVNHKDGNILNCCLDNLEWYSQSSHVNSLYTQEETWKVLDGYDDPVYEISSKGRLINKKNNKLMNGSTSVDGYLVYSLYKNKKKKGYFAHRLVAQNFLTQPVDEKQNIVNHKDGNKTNNSVENLEWTTNQENIQHAYDNNLINVYTRKIKQYTLDDVFIREFSGATEATQVLNVKNATGIIKACSGVNKTAYGFKWKYSEENPTYFELPGEEWKQFRDAPYWVSNTGRVKNKFNKIMSFKGSDKERKSLSFFINKKDVTFAVHRLVAECFIPNPDNLPQVDHIDKNPLNNHASNLRWISGLDNIRHSFAKKVDQLDLNGNLIKTWDCIMDVASELGIDRVGISKVCTGVQKTCGGFRWRHSLLNN